MFMEWPQITKKYDIDCARHEVIFCHRDRFQLPVSYQCWKIIKMQTFYVPFLQFSTHRAKWTSFSYPEAGIPNAPADSASPAWMKKMILFYWISEKLCTLTMMTSSNITQHFALYWTFVRGIHRSRWIAPTKASDVELWCFIWSAPE